MTDWDSPQHGPRPSRARKEAAAAKLKLTLPPLELEPLSTTNPRFRPLSPPQRAG